MRTVEKFQIPEYREVAIPITDHCMPVCEILQVQTTNTYKDGPIPVLVLEISEHRYIFQYRYRQSKSSISIDKYL